MSLDYNLTACPEPTEFYWTEQQGRVTEAIVFYTMFLGVNPVTEDNVETFVRRAAVHAEVYGGALLQQVRDGEPADLPVTAEMLKPYIGLRTNATPLSAQKFTANMQRIRKERGAEIAR